MLGFDDDDDAARLEFADHGVGDLGGKTLLNLRAFGVQVDDPGQF